jgi:hypothetical protein
MTAIDDEESSMRTLTNYILRDYSLTLKLLRAANSSYHLRTGKPILSVTHAVVMLGIDAVRNLAGSALIFEHFHKKSAGVCELMLLSLLTANHVRGIAERVGCPQIEEAYLSGMVRNIGELLVAYYHPRQYASILALMQAEQLQAATACLRILRFTFEDLGQAIVRRWRMPERVAQCQKPFIVPGPGAGNWDKPETRFMAAVSLGHLMTTSVFRQNAQGANVSLKIHLQDHSPILSLSTSDVREILESAVTDTSEVFAMMRIQSDDLRLRAQTKRALLALQEQEAEEIPKPGDVLESLTAEVKALADAGGDLDLNGVILMVIEAIFRGGGFDHVIFGFVNPEGSRIVGRAGLGENIESLLAKFNFPLTPRGSPVVGALLRKQDIMVNAASEPSHELVKAFGAGWLAIYPVVVDSRVVGCLYFESVQARPCLSTREISLLEELRGVIVTAIQRLRRELPRQ